MEKVWDVIIVGAGAAGLAAANFLHSICPDNYLVLEARDRIGELFKRQELLIPGGRVHTDYSWAKIPIELGGEFIHGDAAVTHALVQMNRCSIVPVERFSEEHMWWSSGNKTPAVAIESLPKEERHMIRTVWQEEEDLVLPTEGFLYLIVQGDMSLHDYLAEKRGYSENPEFLEAANILLSQTWCSHAKNLSVADLWDDKSVDHTGEGESRVAEGYGALFQKYSENLNIKFHEEVQEIQWNLIGASVRTENYFYKCKQLIITLPLGVLKSQAVSFSPPLPPSKLEAVSNMVMSPAIKLIYKFKKLLWNPKMTFMCHPGSAPRWWTPGYNRTVAEGENIISCYVTAEKAEFMDGIDPQEALDIGLKELSELLGKPFTELKSNLVGSRLVSWGKEPFTRGGYACVKVGAPESRKKLAEPIGHVIFFAGEATAYHSNRQTIHGALESGTRAAHEAFSSRISNL